MRDKAYRRQERKRWIDRRLFIVKNIWLETPWPWLYGGSRFGKYNLTCRPRCGLCKPHKRWSHARKRTSWQLLMQDY